MTEENKNIHDFDFDLISDYFSQFERQGPGSPEVTIKAISFVDNLSTTSKIADIGSGTGGQTMVLAQHAPGQITAIDLFPKFIDKLNALATQLNLQDRIKGIQGSMENLPFQEEELDLIWSEGAIYNIGFEKGLKEWKKFLKIGGYIAVTEASWFTDRRPKEIQDFWDMAYPEIDMIPKKVAQLQNAGYIPVAVFILPENCWTDNYYVPQAKIIEDFLNKHKGNPTAEGFIAEIKKEIRFYSQYKEYYGYVFYIGRKI